MRDLVLLTVFVGLAGGGLALLVRAAPWPQDWKQKKPLGCSACMGGWASIAALGVTYLIVPAEALGSPGAVLLVWLGATAIAAVASHVGNPPAPLPPPDLLFPPE